MPERSNLAQLARDWLRAGGVEMRPAMEIDNIDVIKQVVAAGLGVALVPEVALTLDDPVAGLSSRPLDPPLALRLGLIQRRNAPDDPALSIVRDAIMTLARPIRSPPLGTLPAADLGYAAVSQASATSAANRIRP